MTNINWSNVTTFQQVLEGANTTSGGAFWVATLYLFFFVLVIVMSRTNFTRGVLAGSGISLVIGVFMAFMGLVNYWWIAPFFAIALITILYTIFSQNE